MWLLLRLRMLSSFQPQQRRQRTQQR